jgi:tetratricopeptide (TPR) repeat protein
VPSLGSDLSALFIVDDGNKNFERAKDPVVLASHPVLLAITALADSYIEALKKDTPTFPGSDTEEPPSSLLWTLFLRAQLAESAGDYTKALALLDECLIHTPTAVDVYERKGRILKLSGDIQGAADILDVARDLDLADRYINNKTVKYMLRAGKNVLAEQRIGLFTRHEAAPTVNLFEMQCAWFELELADSYRRKGELGPAIKKYGAIESHFEDFVDDQFDFHTYCIRRMTLRAYTSILHFEDALYGHKYYRAAAAGIIKCYMFIFDHVGKEQSFFNGAEDYTEMTPAEKKKAKAAARKAKVKKAAAIDREEVQVVKAAAKEADDDDDENDDDDKDAAAKKKKKGGGGGGPEKPLVVDEDPNGELLLKKEPLAEMKKYSSSLTTHASNFIDTWILSYDVSMRRGEKVLALEALQKAAAIDKEDGQLTLRIVDFSLRGALGDDIAEDALSTIVVGTAKLLGGVTVQEYLKTLQKSGACRDLPKALAVAQAMVIVNGESDKQAAIDFVTNFGVVGTKKSDAKTCKLVLLWISSVDESAAAKWRAAISAKFPIAKSF